MPTVPDEQSEVKKRATVRLVIAGLLIAAAVGILSVLSQKKPEKIVTTPPTTEATAPAEVSVPPPAPEPPAPAPAAETPPPPPPEVPATPQAAPAPSPALPQPQVAQPGPAAKAQPALQAQSKPQAASAPQPPAQPKPAEAAREAPKPAPQTAKAAEAALAPTKPAEMAAPKGYVVQLGVFSNPANAQQLQARLAEHGIQSYTETRLNVGPFKDKTEADRAYAKIRELGINAVVVQNR